MSPGSTFVLKSHVGATEGVEWVHLMLARGLSAQVPPKGGNLLEFVFLAFLVPLLWPTGGRMKIEQKRSCYCASGQKWNAQTLRCHPIGLRPLADTTGAETTWWWSPQVGFPDPCCSIAAATAAKGPEMRG